MSSQDYLYFEKQLTELVDVSIDILSKSGRCEFFYHLSEADLKKGSVRQRLSSGFIEEFTRYLKLHNVCANYLAKFKSFQITIDLQKCVLDIYRFKAVTEALKVFPVKKIAA